ncbi:MFS transporter [Evansella halocellulosilytica]|uniref:MFS transporter n=1 Tax=Evansella halocellulosilytica TaxID=2011013 RepID=UPI000BB826C2|nr:MFS transporter [Evansella halocellulosilytica]
MTVSAKKRVIGIALITAISVIGDAMLFIVLPLYWQEFGLTALWQIGLLLSINRFIRLPINPLVGLFYKHFQLRTGVLIAVILAVVTTASYGLLHDFWLLVMMRALWGVAWSLLRLGGFLTVVDVTNEQNRGQYVGYYNGLWGIGGLIGMLGGGFLVDQTSIVFVTSLFACLGVLAIPAVLYFVPVTKATEEEKKMPTTATKWFTPYVAMVLVTGVAMGFIIFGLFASTISPLIERTYVSEWSIGQIIIGAATLAGIIQAIRWGWDPFIAPIIGKMLDSSASMLRILLIPLVGGGILFIILGNVRSILLLIVLLLFFQFLSTIFVTTTDTLATSAAAQTDRVKVLTAHTVVVDVGAAFGPFISFLVIEYYSLTSVYDLAGALLIVLGMLWTVFSARNR